MVSLSLLFLQLAEKVGALCVSHLEEVTDAGIEALSRAGIVAVLLPTTQYILRIKCPPARKLIEKGMCSVSFLVDY